MHWGKLSVQSFYQGEPLRSVVLFLAACLCSVVSANGVGAEDSCDAYYEIAVEAMSLDQALIELASQTDQTLVFSFEETQQIRGNQVFGSLTLDAAITRLLMNTGMYFEVQDSGAIRVMAAQAENTEDLIMKKKPIASAIAGVLAFLGADALAQDATTETGPRALRIEEVIVSATRRAADASDVPLAISAFTEDFLAKQGIESFDGVARNTPGVTVTGAASLSRFVVRGIQTSATASSDGEQRQTAIYVDDVPVTSFSVVAPNLRMYDVERVEVLRGPQGTSFGSGSLAGAVRVITNKANVERFEAGVRVDVGTIEGGGDRQRYSGFVNAPLSDEFAVRFTGYYRDDEGFIDNVGTFGFGPVTNENFSDEHGFRASAKWLINENLDATLSYSMDRVDQRALTSTQNQSLASFERATFFSEPVEVDMDIANLTLNWDLDWATLVWSANYAEQSTSWDGDLDAIFGPVLPFSYGESIDSDITINELRLVSNGSERLEYTLGLYHLDHDSERRGSQGILDGYLQNFGVDMSAVPELRAGFDAIASVFSDIENIESAVFAEVSYALSDQWRVFLGGRYTRYEFNRLDRGNFVTDALPLAFSGAGGMATVIPLPDAAFSTGTENEPTIKAGIQFAPDDDQMWYLSVAEGFRRSHPNANLTDIVDPDAPDFIPEVADADTLWSYELGYKAKLMDGRMSLEAALYFIDWSDAMVSASRQSDASPYVTNAGDVESMGFELSTRLLVSEALEMGGTFAFNESEVVSISARESLSSGLTKGGSLVAPETQASFYFQWQAARFGDAAVNVRADVQYVAGYQNGPDNIPGVGVPNPRVTDTDAITNVSAQVGYETNHWGLYLYAENLGNDDGLSWVNPDPFSNNTVTTLFPRTIGLRLDYSY